MTTLLKQSTEQMDIEIGRRIRDFRLIRGVTQEILGDAIGVSFQQIQKYEKGKNRIATSTLVKICQRLEVAPTDVIGGYFNSDFDMDDLVKGIVEENKLLKTKIARIRAIFGQVDDDSSAAIGHVTVNISSDPNFARAEARRQ
jgi:transcriptional regulator with XRE-family HTH domain